MGRASGHDECFERLGGSSGTRTAAAQGLGMGGKGKINDEPSRLRAAGGRAAMVPTYTGGQAGMLSRRSRERGKADAGKVRISAQCHLNVTSPVSAPLPSHSLRLSLPSSRLTRPPGAEAIYQYPQCFPGKSIPEGGMAPLRFIAAALQHWHGGLTGPANISPQHEARCFRRLPCCLAVSSQGVYSTAAAIRPWGVQQRCIHQQSGFGDDRFRTW